MKAAILPRNVIATSGVAIPIAIPTTTMNTASKGRSLAEWAANWDGTLLHFPSTSYPAGGCS